MASKKSVDFSANLRRLDKVSGQRADEIVGPSPGTLLEERLNKAAQLEERGRAPLAAVVKLQAAADDGRTLLAIDGTYRAYEVGMPVRVGERLHVPLERLKPNPLNPRAFYFDEDIKDRSISLATDGQLQAVQVYPPDVTGFFELHDGETRLRSLKLVGHTTVNVEVVERDPSPLVRFKQARALNTERKSQTVFDDAVRFTDLCSQKLVGNNLELATAFGLQPVYVSKVLSIGELPRHVLERMAHHAELFGIANAYAVYQHWVANERQLEVLEKLVSRIVDKRMSVRDVKALLEAPKASAQAAPARKRERPLSRAEVRLGAKGELKAFPDGKLQLELTDIPEANRAVLFKRILQLFDECGLRYDAVNVPADAVLAAP